MARNYDHLDLPPLPDSWDQEQEWPEERDDTEWDDSDSTREAPEFDRGATQAADLPAHVLHGLAEARRQQAAAAAFEATFLLEGGPFTVKVTGRTHDELDLAVTEFNRKNRGKFRYTMLDAGPR